MRSKLISLLSDFGLKDPYVAEMKAVILSICPRAGIVDISHQIQKFNIRMGAFELACAAPYFPKGTIHTAIVDPGVGTSRRPILIETARSFFVGPDNGLLIPAAAREGIRAVYVLQNPKYMLPQVSNTFHGRDIFAPTAAHLAKGHTSSEIGKRTQNFEPPSFAEAQLDGCTVVGEVLHVDCFGNIITNIHSESLREQSIHAHTMLKIQVAGETVTLKFGTAYYDVPKGKAMAILGGHGFLEISINQGNAAEQFNVGSRDPIRVQLDSL